MNEMSQPITDYFTSPFKARYDNFIGGRFVPPMSGQYFDNATPITGAKICEVARSGAADVEAALDAAHAAREAWGATSAAERSNILLKICPVGADVRHNSSRLAMCWPIRWAS
ncbi:Aldehyde dehydrogenase family protein [Aliiruegeria lutimaris]|uniref:Aldehyde dehydrogenase family protein n=1 Tax=Aliiruegeria lutimaris TaxID=571298 RepID=A0A1G9HWH1_9RHOB|nr:Aldehyde dehydrogenase family protein [Aliiruegeria lutimaris]